MRRGIVIAAVAVVALGVGAAVLFNGSTADAGTTTDAAVLACNQECAVDCSACPGHAATPQPETGAVCGHAEDGCAVTECDHDCAGCTADHHVDADCPCGGDRAACTEEMKAACEHHASCDCSHHDG